MKSAHLYLAPGFEEVEAIGIADVLRRAGVDLHLVSLSEELAVRGAHGIEVKADLPFAAADGLVDAIVLPGGGPGTRNLLASQPLAERLRAHHAAGKRVAAICAAPMVLAAAGLLEGRRACCFPGCEEDLRRGGAELSAYNVVTDELITTSRGPGTAALFGLELARLLVGEGKALEVGRAMLVV